jgi:hypothetical protein
MGLKSISLAELISYFWTSRAVCISSKKSSQSAAAQIHDHKIRVLREASSTVQYFR